MDVKDAAAAYRLKAIPALEVDGVPPGYKRTEVGVIPQDWNSLPLGNVVTLRRGFDLPYRLRKRGDVPIVTSSGVEDTHSEAKVRGPGVVTGRYGTIGEVFLVLVDFWPLNTTLYVTRFHKNDPAFVSYLLRTLNFHEYSGKSGVPGINRNDLHTALVPLPPTKAEQQTIAEALSDADALIAALQRLIAKKRAIKQGAMQALLTGRQRLPGFTGEWLEIPFGEAAAPRKERVDPRVAGPHNFCVELEHIQSGMGIRKGHTVATSESSLKTVFHPGDVLFGKLRAYLRKYWRADQRGICSTEIWSLATKGCLRSSQLLFQIVQTTDFIEAASLAYGTHMPRSDWKSVKEHEITIPSDPEEQTAIATVLSDMDTEIDALEARLAKTRQLKVGMMQQLLIGRIRLPLQDAA